MPKLALETGVALHYVRGGRASEETVVFVNGLTMDTSAWRPVAELLGADYATLRYDCRGQGESEKPAGPYPPEQHRDDLLALLDGLELPSVHLVGLSNGGLVSLLAAGKSPERVKSLAMIDSFGHSDAQFRLVLASWKQALAVGGAGLRFEVATPWVWGQAFLAEHLDEVLAFREVAAGADPAVIGYLIDGVAGLNDARSSFESYLGPFLAVVGEDDVLTPPRYSRALVEAAGRGEVVVLPETGHAAPIERPSEVARVLERFLASSGRLLEGGAMN